MKDITYVNTNKFKKPFERWIKKTLHILIRSDKIDDYGVTSAEETSSIIKEKKER